MIDADKPAFLRALNGLASIKPGKPLTAEGLEMFWLSLRDWPLAEFLSAATHLATAAEFMPNPYHFQKLRQAAQPTAGESWAKVLEYVRSGERGDPPGGKIDRVVRAMGGYWAIGQSPTDKTQFLERRFSELWADQGEAEEVRQALPSLATSPRIAAPRAAMFTLPVRQQ